MDSEKEKTKLLELQAITAAVESTDQGKAESQAQVERMLIECESEIESAKLKAEAEEIEHMAKLETQGLANLLQGLGIQSVLVTDGTTPIINLFETAHGLIGS